MGKGHAHVSNAGMVDIQPDERRAPRPKGRSRRAVEREASQWVARHSLGALAGEARERFEAWLEADPAHGAAFDRLSGTLSALDGAGPVVREADRRARAATRTRSIRRTGAALAVSCVALVTAVALVDLPAEFADVRTERGETRALTLADGSRLLLDADSAVNLAYGAGERRIALVRGRVHAEVRHGDPRPFRIAALGGEVEDVGTAFDVALEEDGAFTVVTEGEVIARSGGTGLSLTRGHAARWREGSAPRPLALARIEEAEAWRHGRLVFDQRPLGEVLATLDRYASRRIWLWNGDAATLRVSGVVRSESVDASLASLVRAQGLKVRNIGVALVVY